MQPPSTAGLHPTSRPCASSFHLASAAASPEALHSRPSPVPECLPAPTMGHIFICLCVLMCGVCVCMCWYWCWCVYLGVEWWSGALRIPSLSVHWLEIHLRLLGDIDCWEPIWLHSRTGGCSKIQEIPPPVICIIKASPTRQQMDTTRVCVWTCTSWASLSASSSCPSWANAADLMEGERQERVILEELREW